MKLEDFLRSLTLSSGEAGDVRPVISLGFLFSKPTIFEQMSKKETNIRANNDHVTNERHSKGSSNE